MATLLLPVLALIAQGLRGSVSVALTVACAALIVAGLWIKRVLIVVPVMFQNVFLHEVGTYVPTWVEYILVGGTFVAIALIFLLFTKVFPILPVSELEEGERE